VWADAARAAALRFTLDTLTEDAERTRDRRRRYRLARRADELRHRLAVLEGLERRRDAAERALWADLWTHAPAAALWPPSAGRDVAAYVRFKIRAEHGDYRAATEARHWSDRLGLNPRSFLALRLRDALADAITTRRRRRPSPPLAAASVLTQAHNRAAQRHQPTRGPRP